jgi:hypothetical protein
MQLQLMMGYARSATLGALLVFFAEALSAQSIPSSYRFIETRHEVGLYAGYLFIDPGELGQAPESGPMVGARYDIHFTGPLSGEVGLGLLPTNRQVKARSGTSTTLVDLEETDALLLSAEAGLRFHLTGQRAWRGLAPYALATAGIVADLAGTGALERQIVEEERFTFGPTFAASAGLGSQFFLTDKVSLRVEARDNVWRLSYPDIYRPAGIVEEDAEWAHNFGLTIGGAIHF